MPQKQTIRPALAEKTQIPCRSPVPKLLYGAFLVSVMACLLAVPAYAATDVWTKASEIMQDVYSQIVLISTIAAIVTAATALLMTNFARNDRSVNESRAWLKRICISWAILNSLGFIMAYVTPFFADGKWAA